MPEKSKTKEKITPVRLRELAAPIREEALKRDVSVNWLIREACKKLLGISSKKSTVKKEGA